MARIGGRIFERDSDGGIGETIAGTRLTFEGTRRETVQSGASGSYQIDLPNGRYRVKIEARGFETQFSTVVLTRARQTFNVFLDKSETAERRPEPTGFVGRVFQRTLEGSIGDEIQGASMVFLMRGRVVLRLQSGANGSYRATLAPGRYELRVKADGVEDFSQGVQVTDRFRVFNVFMKEMGQAQEDDCHCAFPGSENGTDVNLRLVLPGESEAKDVTLRDVDGVAVADGGIVLGRVEDLRRASRDLESTLQNANEASGDRPDGLRSVGQALVATAGANRLWTGGIVPYQFQANVPVQVRERTERAIEAIENVSAVRFIPSDGTGDFVTVRIHGESSSWANLGRIGGEQFVNLSIEFDIGGIVHELFHTLGILHEQSRNDRDFFVTINDGTNGTPNNILSGSEHNFRKSGPTARDIGPYDYESTMHYSATAFGIEDNMGVTQATIVPRTAGVNLGAGRSLAAFLTPNDINGLNRLYPVGIDFEGGALWGNGNYATDIAFGDVDNDGVDEVVVTRKASSNARFMILNDGRSSTAPHATLFRGGTDWGSSTYATCCAVGDIDGDGRAEIAIGRKATGNMRFSLIRFVGGMQQVDELETGGENWGREAYTTDVAIGRDRFGTGLLAVARKSTTNGRFFVYRYDASGLTLLFSGGANWGRDFYATSIAMGDMDNDGRLEIAVGRFANQNARFQIYKTLDGTYSDLRLIHSGGENWGSGSYTTGLCFGDVDGDGRMELGVSRKTSGNGRYFIIGGPDSNFRRIHTGGHGWGSGYYATDIAMGDIDGDGRAETMVARRSNENDRTFLFDDASTNFMPLGGFGASWGNGNYATAVDIGRTATIGGPQAALGIARRAGQNSRFFINRYR